MDSHDSIRARAEKQRDELNGRGLRPGAVNYITPEAAALATMEAAHKGEAAALVAERGKTHGDWADNAGVAQELKGVIQRAAWARRERGQPDLTEKQKESLEMICHKIGRIMAGDASFPDHWDDIGGYAKIANN